MTASPLPYWKVVKPHGNGGKILGRRRALHEVFQAAEPLVRFLLAEGILVHTDAAGTPVT